MFDPTRIPVVDCHCHVYPQKIAEKASQGIGAFYELSVSYNGTLAGLLSAAAPTPITHHILSSVATKPEQVASVNRYLAGLVADASGEVDASLLPPPGTLFALGTLHPDLPDPEKDVEEILALGLCGVKMHPDIQRFALDDARSIRLARLCEKKRLPLLLHTGDKRYDFSNPEHLLPLIDACPDLTVIGAHFGGWSIWNRAFRELRGLPRFFVDCSSSFFAMSRDEALEAVDAYGADHILFGTDYPLWRPGPELDFLLSLGLSDGDYEKILFRNAAEVFGLPIAPDENSFTMKTKSK